MTCAKHDSITIANNETSRMLEVSSQPNVRSIHKWTCDTHTYSIQPGPHVTDDVVHP